MIDLLSIAISSARRTRTSSRGLLIALYARNPILSPCLLNIRRWGAFRSDAISEGRAAALTWHSFRISFCTRTAASGVIENVSLDNRTSSGFQYAEIGRAHVLTPV